jgi:hypothetical protein
MRKSTVLAGLIGIGAFFYCPGVSFSQNVTAKSHWTAAPLKVDGQDEEWRTDHLSIGEKVNVVYAFRNDGRDLYVLLVLKDRRYLRAIDNTGITIYCNPQGKKRKKDGLRFIKRMVPADRFIAMLENQGTALTEKEKGELQAKPQHQIFEAYLVNKKGKPTVPPDAARAAVEPPAFGATTSGDIVTYEFRLPLVFPGGYPEGMGAQPGKTIQVCVEWGGSSKKTLNAKASWPTPDSIVSGSVTTGADETRAQEFLSTFDSMANPSIETKKYSFWIAVELARQQ